MRRRATVSRHLFDLVQLYYHHRPLHLDCGPSQYSGAWQDFTTVLAKGEVAGYWTFCAGIGKCSSCKHISQVQSPMCIWLTVQVAWTAFQQRLEARRICVMLRSHFNQPPLPSTLETIRRKAKSFLNWATFWKQRTKQKQATASVCVSSTTLVTIVPNVPKDRDAGRRRRTSQSTPPLHHGSWPLCCHVWNLCCHGWNCSRH